MALDRLFKFARMHGEGQKAPSAAESLKIELHQAKGKNFALILTGLACFEVVSSDKTAF